jgi:hypothetical protein
MPRKPRPSQISGQAVKPSKRQQQGAKNVQPWDTAEQAAKRALKKLNPFD